jgi:hypothetical protein
LQIGAGGLNRRGVQASGIASGLRWRESPHKPRRDPRQRTRWSKHGS